MSGQDPGDPSRNERTENTPEQLGSRFFSLPTELRHMILGYLVSFETVPRRGKRESVLIKFAQPYLLVHSEIEGEMVRIIWNWMDRFAPEALAYPYGPSLELPTLLIYIMLRSGFGNQISASWVAEADGITVNVLHCMKEELHTLKW
jgi:hypothetical protein